VTYSFVFVNCIVPKNNGEVARKPLLPKGDIQESLVIGFAEAADWRTFQRMPKASDWLKDTGGRPHPRAFANSRFIECVI
jgi:hypothetical protein